MATQAPRERIPSTRKSTSKNTFKCSSKYSIVDAIKRLPIKQIALAIAETGVCILQSARTVEKDPQSPRLRNGIVAVLARFEIEKPPPSDSATYLSLWLRRTDIASTRSPDKLQNLAISDGRILA